MDKMMNFSSIASFRKIQLEKKKQEQEKSTSIQSSSSACLEDDHGQAISQYPPVRSSISDSPMLSQSNPEVSLRKKPQSADLRQKSLEMYKSINSMMARKKDSFEIERVSVDEVEGYASDFAYQELERVTTISSDTMKMIARMISSLMTVEVLRTLVCDDNDEMVSVAKLKSYILNAISQPHMERDIPSLSRSVSHSCNIQTRRSFNEKLKIEITSASTQGNRKTMEDQHVIIPYLNEYAYKDFNVNANFKEFQEPMVYVGVYDGHVGGLAAEYARTHLHVNILREYQGITTPSTSLSSSYSSYSSFGDYKSSSSNSEYNYSEGNLEIDYNELADSIKRAYQKTHDNFSTMATRDKLSSGTTAVSVLVSQSMIFVANVGDTEAVLCRSGKANTISTAHLPNEESEKERIVKAGGTVVWFGTWRVNGLLSVSRSLGDLNLSEIISPQPSIDEREREKSDEFMIIATDGLWDVMQHQEACDIILQQLVLDRSKIEIANHLVEEAILRKSNDNVTVVLIFLK